MDMRRLWLGGDAVSMRMVLAVSCVVACAPRGEPPAGRQIVADRSASLVELIPASRGGVLRALFYRRSATAGRDDLWAISVDGDGNPLPETSLFIDVGPSGPPSYLPTAEDSPVYPIDARGRIYVGGVRVDPGTGQSVQLGDSPRAVLSASGQRVLLHAAGTGFVVYEADDTATVLSDVSSYRQFAGETLFYLTSSGNLMRVVAGGGPERLAAGVNAFSVVPSAQPQLLLSKADVDSTQPGLDTPSSGPPPTDGTATLFDGAALQETPLPSGPNYRQAAFSPDGHWVVAPQRSSGASSGGYALINLQSGTVEALNPAFSLAYWRPGHDEVWAAIFDQDATDVSGWTLWIKRSGQPLVSFPGLNCVGFTDDGAHFFSTQTIPTGTMAESNLIGSADDPAGPRTPLVPAGSSLMNHWTFGDGRLLVESSIPGSDAFEDFYLQLVDPNSGAVHLFGEHGVASAVGQARALGVVQVSYEHGDLASYDLTNGKTTILAPEFAMAAVAEPHGSDAYPPGGGIVYQYRAIYDSPWDGLWLTTAP